MVCPPDADPFGVEVVLQPAVGGFAKSYAVERRGADGGEGGGDSLFPSEHTMVTLPTATFPCDHCQRTMVLSSRACVMLLLGA